MAPSAGGRRLAAGHHYARVTVGDGEPPAESTADQSNLRARRWRGGGGVGLVMINELE